MTHATIEALLAEIAERVGSGAILWRGADLGGSDVDLLVLPDGARELADTLAREGLVPAAGDPGHVVWSRPGLPPLDVLPASAWPSHYPDVAGVASRARARPGLPPVAADEDRALMFAAEAVAGKPVEKVARKLRAILAEPQARERIEEHAEREGARELAAVATDPDGLEAAARRGRLPYPRAAKVAARGPLARAALAARASARARRAVRSHAAPRGAPRPLLVTLSGMDGAGKSTAAETLLARLASAGVPAEMSWARLGSESRLLDGLATPVKRLLRRQGTTADPVAAGGPEVGKVQDEREAAGRRRLVSWVWIAIVAWANARSYRDSAAGRRRGVSVVCDRWATDALVDLELRYGRHALAEAILRRLPPRPDLAILLEIDAASAHARKPGDQAVHVLEGMERRYSRVAEEERLVRVDATAPRAEVAERLGELVDALVERRAG